MFRYISGTLGLQSNINAYHWPRGAMVARLTPDQKVACSNHVGVIVFNLLGPELFFFILACPVYKM